MGRKGQVKLSTVRRALDRCAEGYSCRETEHRFRIGIRAQVYFLEKGGHKRVSMREVSAVSVRKMLKALAPFSLDVDCFQRVARRKFLT